MQRVVTTGAVRLSSYHYYIVVLLISTGLAAREARFLIKVVKCEGRTAFVVMFTCYRYYVNEITSSIVIKMLFCGFCSAEN